MLVGSALVSYVLAYWIELAGGVIMFAYGVWSYSKGLGTKKRIDGEEGRSHQTSGRSGIYAFLAMLLSLMILDLAGDATELVSVLFVAQYGQILAVFFGAVAGLVAASALETMLGNKLGKLLTARGARYLSTAVFLIIGTVIIATSVFGL